MNITLKKSFIATVVASLFAMSAANAQTSAPTATAKPAPAKTEAKKSPAKAKNNSCKPEKGMSVKVKLTTSMGDMVITTAPFFTA
jgi:Rieske Fe-S protein